MRLYHFILTILILLIIKVTYFFYQNTKKDVKKVFLIPVTSSSSSSANSENKSISHFRTSIIESGFSPQDVLWVNKDLVNLKQETIYSDPKALFNCGYTFRRPRFFKILQWWIKFAAENDITWWLKDGSLIGSLRHEDMIPYDLDMDISVLKHSERVIQKLSTPRGKISTSNILLVTRIAGHCIYDEEPMASCEGKPVKSFVDGCSFCVPFARVAYNIDFARMDIFTTHLEYQKDILKLYDESYQISNKRPMHDYEEVFPLKRCKFMQLTLPCPADSAKYLRDYYGDFSIPTKVCINGTWTKRN